MKEEVLASTIGLLLTDGGISVWGKKQLEVFLTSNSQALRNLFEKNIKQLFPERKLKFQTINGKTVKKIRICDKEVGRKLLEFSPTFRTRRCDVFPTCPRLRGLPQRGVCRECKPINGFPPVKIPEFIKEGSIELKRTILRVAMSCDGGIEFHEIVQKRRRNLQRRLFLRCHNPNLLQEWEKIFNDCGFKVTKTKNEIRITGKDQLKKFRNEIGFIEGVKVMRSKNWRGIDKNQLLDLVINSFDTNSAPKA